MNANEKNIEFFGSIKSLDEKIPWTTGVSNMVEHLLWDTRSVLGISKAEFWKKILFYTEEKGFDSRTRADKESYITQELKTLLQKSEAKSRDEPPKSGYCSAREALRRNKYHYEDYLNKEFDIFMNLSSDSYLDYLYSRFISFKPNGSWSTHGGSPLFYSSLNMNKMGIDNLAYNTSEGLLVANELKLGGSKNPDQILKYCFMHKILEEKRFVKRNGAFLLLFIGVKNELENVNLEDMIEEEIAYCTKKNWKHLITPEIINKAKSITVKSLTWSKLIEINEQYLTRLSEDQQVERKLIDGFNTALKEKPLIKRENQEKAAAANAIL